MSECKLCRVLNVDTAGHLDGCPIRNLEERVEKMEAENAKLRKGLECLENNVVKIARLFILWSGTATR